MAQPHAKTTFIVANDRDAVILEKLAGMEQAIERLLPVLEKILMHLETQTVKAPAPMATYADLYEEEAPGPPEGELVAARALAPQPRPRRWWTRLLWGPV